MEFETKSGAIAAMVSNPAKREWCYWISFEGNMVGSVLLSVDTNKYHNICVIHYFVRSDENLEKEIFKEFFEGVYREEKLPIYFKASMLEEDTKELLREIGAIETTDADEQTIWYAEQNCKVFKLG